MFCLASTRAQRGKFTLGTAILVLALGGCANMVQQRVEAFNEDGVQLFAKGDYRSAQESFEAALNLTPNDPSLLYNLGQCHDRLGDWRTAEHYYLSCLRVAPNHADARFAQIALLYRTGRQPEANRLIEDWARSEKNKADALVLDAWRLRQDRALPEAQSRLQQALALDPHNSRALIELGIIYEMTNMPERAYALYERALQANPKQPEVAERLRKMKAKGIQRPLPD